MSPLAIASTVLLHCRLYTTFGLSLPNVAYGSLGFIHDRASSPGGVSVLLEHGPVGESTLRRSVNLSQSDKIYPPFCSGSYPAPPVCDRGDLRRIDQG